MRKQLRFCSSAILSVVLTIVTSSAGSAALLLYDGFDYTVGGTLSPNTNTSVSQDWNTSPTGSGVPTIAAGSLSYPLLPASTGQSVMHDRTKTGLSRINLPGQPYSATTTLYYSLLVTVPEITAPSNSAGGSFLAGFNNGIDTDTTGGALDQAGQLFIRKEVVATVPTGNFQLGVDTNNSGSPATQFSPLAFAPGTTVFAVVRYDLNPGTADDVATLYLNPVPGAPEPVLPSAMSLLGSDIGSDPTFSERGLAQLRSFYLRNNGVQAGNLRVDELRIGTTYADVTPAIPEPGSIALAVAAGLALGGWRYLNRR